MLLAAVALSAGCAASPSAKAPPAAGAAPGFPLTIDNCGVEVRLDAPPQRVVTIHQHPAEIMYALGLERSMVGTAYPDNPYLPQFAAANASVPQLAEQSPSFEQVLSAQPDLVYGGYKSAFSADKGTARETYQQAGIATYQNTEACTSPVTMDTVWSEIRTVARMFGVPDRGEALVVDLQRQVDAATARVAGVPPVSVFVYDSGEETAYTAGGRGISNDVISRAGGRNVFGDLDRLFGDVSFEQVAQRAPKVIIIYDYGGDRRGVEAKKQFLLARPELAGVPAVRDQRFVTMTLQDGVVGVRPPQAVEPLARALHPDRFR
ncbi:ABC transporter substrate-binding protein [Pseudonocardia phyllosphaerae]|uniref:ABC transporter substrate-binding protein n=1 Tax=Pseudonocardia phyllosphaerae TaxID=3390502 RepID=UPI003978436F